MPNFWKSVNHVLEDADIILEVLDARLIDETRNIEIENKIKKKNKKIIYVINKCDLTSQKFLDEKKKELSPCVFVSSTEYHGMKMLKEKIFTVGKDIEKVPLIVGVVGYPNTGKSSVINAISGKGSAKTSSYSGYTRGVQKIRARKKIMFMDTPGVIPFLEKDEVKHALIGTLNPQKVKDPDVAAMQLIEYLDGVIENYYGVEKHPEEDFEETLEEIALKLGCIKKGNTPDIDKVSRKILLDWQGGKIKLGEE